MYKVGYIKVSDKTHNFIIPKHSWIPTLLPQKVNEISIDDFFIGEIELKYPNEQKINKALKILQKNGAVYVIIQKQLNKIISEETNALSNMLKLEGTILKKICLELAVKRFLKYVQDDKTKKLKTTKSKPDNYLFILDSFKNNFSKRFIDVIGLILYVAKSCSNLILLFNDEREFDKIEDFIMENTGLCPVCTKNPDTALKLEPNVIFNFSTMNIDYSIYHHIHNLQNNQKYYCYIFDLCYNENNCARGKNRNDILLISDYEVRPPERYKNLIPGEIYNETAEGLFFHLNSNIPLSRLSNISTENEYNKITQLIEDQGFKARLK